MRHVAPANPDAAGGDALQPRDHPQHGGLAAPRGTDEDHELPVRNLQVDAVDRHHRAEVLGDTFQRELGHRHPFTAPMVNPLMK